jgi:condensin complex subunit 1
MIALSDLVLRWPNSLEPWTVEMYAPLSDPDAHVRINTMMVLSHLILNEMMKVKGNISKVCLRLLDTDPQVRGTVRGRPAFFHLFV